MAQTAERRVALVTGAGRGIGRAIALKLADDGMDIVLHFNAAAPEVRATTGAVEAKGVRAAACQADLADLSAVRRLVPCAIEALGRLDVLVNNAGVYNTTSFERVTPELWEETFAVNLRAIFFLCQSAADYLGASGNGVVVNLASGGGLSPRPGFPVSAPYAASKAGVVMLTRVLALELAPRVRVNAVAPGVVESKRKPMSAAAKAKFSAMTPLRRVGQPLDVAEAVAFLASDAARFITGQILSVDGGLVMA